MTKDNQKGILRLPEVSELVKLSRATIYRMIKSNEFPRPIQIGLRSVGWLPKEINIWLESRPHTPPLDRPRRQKGKNLETKGKKSGESHSIQHRIRRQTMSNGNPHEYAKTPGANHGDRGVVAGNPRVRRPAGGRNGGGPEIARNRMRNEENPSRRKQ